MSWSTLIEQHKTAECLVNVHNTQPLRRKEPYRRGDDGIWAQ